MTVDVMLVAENTAVICGSCRNLLVTESSVLSKTEGLLLLRITTMVVSSAPKLCSYLALACFLSASIGASFLGSLSRVRFRHANNAVQNKIKKVRSPAFDLCKQYSESCIKS